MSVAFVEDPRLATDVRKRLAQADARWSEVVEDFELGVCRHRRAAGHADVPVDAREAVARLSKIAADRSSVVARLRALGESVEDVDLGARAWSDLRGPKEAEVDRFLCRSWEAEAAQALAVRATASEEVERLKTRYASGEIGLDVLDAKLPAAQSAYDESVRRLNAIGYDPDQLAKAQAEAVARFGGVEAVAEFVKAARIGLGEHEEATSSYAEARSAEAEAADLDRTLKRLAPTSLLAASLKARVTPAKGRVKLGDAQAVKDADASALKLAADVDAGSEAASDALASLGRRIPAAFPDGFAESFGRPLELTEAQLKGVLAILLGV